MNADRLTSSAAPITIAFPRPARQQFRMTVHLQAVIAVGLLMSLPLFIFGFPPVGDYVFHAQWQSSFTRQFWSGNLFPRWLLESNGGYGGPDFVFYGPAAFHVGAVLGPLLPSDAVVLRQLGASCAVGLILSGIFAYTWLGGVLSRRMACLGAVVYMAVPYHLYVDLCVRGAYGEFWALTWLPLMLHFVRKAATEGTRVVPLAFAYASLAFTHLPTILIFTPFALAYGVQCAWSTEARLRRVALVCLGLALGAAMSAIYWLPAIVLKSYTSSMTDGSVNFASNFIPPATDSGFAWQLQLMTLVTASSLGTLAAALLVVVTRSAGTLDRSALSAVWFWSAAALLAMVMMTPVSAPVWQAVPVLQNVQFPWRFHVVVTVSLALALACAAASAKRSTLHVAAAAMVLALLAVASGLPTSKAGLWDARARINKLTAPMAAKQGALEESVRAARIFAFLPVWAESSRQAFVSEPHRALFGSASSVTVTYWTAGELRFEFARGAPASLTIGQFYFPGWRATVDGSTNLPVRPDPATGLITVKLPPGASQLQVCFDGTPVMSQSLVLSVIALVVTLALGLAPTASRLWRLPSR